MNSSETVLLRNARIVLPDHVTEPGSILIDGDRIAGIFDGESRSSIKNESIVDLTDLTLFPGFIDVHIHGAVGVDTMEASPEGLLQIAEFLATQGVTGWLPTFVPASVNQYAQAIRSIEEAAAQAVCEDKGDHRLKSVPLAQVLGVHYEGPFVNSEQCGALHREHFRTFKSRSDLDELPVVNNPGAIHMMTLAPEIDGGIELIREINRRGWIASIGHTRASLATLNQASEAGARHMTHFMNAMTPLHHRAPGPVGWGLINDSVTVDLIADGVHLDPSVIKLILRAKGTDRISLISDAIAAAGKGDGNYDVWGETIVVNEGRTQNAHGSIAGSVITVLDAVRLMRSLEVSETEVARMAATNPAQLLGLNDRGSIEIGKRADLVALDTALNVKATFVAGVWTQY